MAHTRPILEETNDWSVVLRARAMVIKSHDYPLAWLTRVPDCDEVSTLLSYIVESGATTVSYADGRPDTTDPAMCIHDAACFLLDAIDASDERREGLSFQEAFPASYQALEDITDVECSKCFADERTKKKNRQ